MCQMKNIRYGFLLIVCFLSINTQANTHDAFDNVVRISKNKGTVYELLKDISEQSGYLFISNVQSIPQNERISTKRIFAETKSSYDKNFWEQFNIILPEEDLKRDIIHNLREVLITK